MDFTAIDFETANGYRTSACSIGISHFVDGVCAETHHFLIRPEPFWFLPMNVAVHGIDARMVADADTFGEQWMKLKEHLEGRLLVAHNAVFDIPVLQAVLQYYDLRMASSRYFCSLALSRALWREEPEYAAGGFGLKAMSQKLNIALQHHNAASDAEAAGHIVTHMLRYTGLDSVEDLCLALRYPLGQVAAHGYSGFRRLPASKKSRS